MASRIVRLSALQELAGIRLTPQQQLELYRAQQLLAVKRTRTTTTGAIKEAHHREREYFSMIERDTRPDELDHAGEKMHVARELAKEAVREWMRSVAVSGALLSVAVLCLALLASGCGSPSKPTRPAAPEVVERPMSKERAQCQTNSR